MQVRVTARVEEALDIASFELASADGTPLPAFSAGAHVDVDTGAGLVRQYSLCNDPSEAHRYLIAVLRDPHSRGGSQSMHDRVQPGDLLRISAPKNHFALVPATSYLLLAGGIGITPILCMAQQLAQAGAPFRMHYCTRSPERTAFAERLRSAPFAGRVQFHFDDMPGGRLDIGAVLRDADPGTHLYVCGPAGFIDAATGAASAAGWPGARVHVEHFGASVQDTGGDQAFEIRIASTAQTLHVPAHTSALAVLIAHGIEVPVSCEQGVCGTCVTRVLDGLPEHRDTFLTDEERAANDQFTPCCSRARTATLVLDL
jgi:vanillate O-demethylase ferredoxin subunit